MTTQINLRDVRGMTQAGDLEAADKVAKSGGVLIVSRGGQTFQIVSSVTDALVDLAETHKATVELQPFPF